ncbi:MAG: GP88 family protein [Sphingomonas sp.]|uniref:GP88 family protein n=1 Tax=Sphingomonas sp. TaxID=28214 RepID=UPI003F7F61A8
MNKNESLAALYREAGINGLLSPPESNPKVAKNGKLGVAASVLHLAAGDMSGHEVCPKRSPGCSAACLMTAGNPAYLQGKTQARIKRTKLYFENRDLFMNILVLEIAKAIEKAKAANMDPAFRLNGTSDIVYEKKKFKLYPWVAEKLNLRHFDNTGTILELFPDVQFYDYTKIPGRTPPPNYHLTFSESEINAEDVAKEMARGLNIASVFPIKAVPKTHLGRPVIDGDEHDYRPADPAGVIVGLKVKGLGKQDATGFVHT